MSEHGKSLVCFEVNVLFSPRKINFVSLKGVMKLFSYRKEVWRAMKNPPPEIHSNLVKHRNNAVEDFRHATSLKSGIDARDMLASKLPSFSINFIDLLLSNNMAIT